MFESSTVYRFQTQTSDTKIENGVLYPEGVEADLVGDRAEVSMMDSFGH
jgi:hypothetical protein